MFYINFVAVNFEAYLLSKKIDSNAFKAAEAPVWETWKFEFEQIHPNSFTLQKLNLINPIRRKYPLKVEDFPKAEITTQPKETSLNPEVNQDSPKPVTAKPAAAKPVFRPKPKIN